MQANCCVCAISESSELSESIVAFLSKASHLCPLDSNLILSLLCCSGRILKNGGKKCGIRKGSVKASRKEKVEAIEMRMRGGGAKVGEASLVLEKSKLMFIVIWIQKTNVVFRIRAKFHRFCDGSFNIPFHFAGLLCDSRGRQARNIAASAFRPRRCCAGD